MSRPSKITVLQEQNLWSWETEQTHPTILISDGQQMLTLSYRLAKEAIRELTWMVERIDEARRWV